MEATYVVIHAVSPTLIGDVVRQYTNRLPLMIPDVLSCYIGRSIYANLGPDPVLHARKLRVGTAGLAVLRDLLIRVVDLHYCRADCPTPADFCLGVMFAVAFHIQTQHRKAFYDQVRLVYPSITDNAIKAGAGVSQLDVLPSAAFVRNSPTTPSEVREFTHWLVAVASTRSCEVVEREYFQKYGTTEDPGCPYGIIMKDRTESAATRRPRQSAVTAEPPSASNRLGCAHCKKTGQLLTKSSIPRIGLSLINGSLKVRTPLETLLV